MGTNLKFRGCGGIFPTKKKKKTMHGTFIKKQKNNARDGGITNN